MFDLCRLSIFLKCQQCRFRRFRIFDLSQMYVYLSYLYIYLIYYLIYLILLTSTLNQSTLAHKMTDLFAKNNLILWKYGLTNYHVVSHTCCKLGNSPLYRVSTKEGTETKWL